MLKVLIVGKTRMGKGLCFGGIVLVNSRSVRLLPKAGHSFAKSARINLGDIWNLELKELGRSQVTAPHTEDVRVIAQEYVKTLSRRKLRERILRITDAPLVCPKQLFDNCTRFTERRKALVYRHGAKPQYSTGFWRFDRALHKRLDERGNVRFLYCKDDRSCDFIDQDLVLDVPYVGCDDPVESIPSETLLRFSLSREYRAGKYIGYWLQLSGWFSDTSDATFKPRKRSDSESRLDMRTEQQRINDFLDEMLG